MSAATGLPPALAGWATSLSALTAEVATALGPMLLRLDELLARHDATGGGRGEPDGYDGLASRGGIHRLLASEWALAQEVPEEFLRRAAMSELLYLAPGHRGEAEHGRVHLLLDAGPSMAGAARLVQLAAIIVLHRRALAAGSTLRIGLLHAARPRWHGGDLPALLGAGLAGRTSAEPDPDRLAGWLDGLDRADRLWLVGGARAAALAVRAGLPRVLRLREADWSPAGVSAVEAVLDGERLRLPVPTGPAAVRLLRGEGFRRVERPGAGLVRAPGRTPVLLGDPPSLVLRGTGGNGVISIRVDGGAPGARPRTYPVPGEVVGVGAHHRRLVILYAGHDGRLGVRVIGKRLSRVEEIRIPLEQVGLDAERLAALAGAQPGPVWFDSGSLLWHDGLGWWQLHPPTGAERAEQLAAVLPRPHWELGKVVLRDAGEGSTGLVGPFQPQSLHRFQPAEPVQVLAGASMLAWPLDAVSWVVVHGAGQQRVRLTVDRGATVLGIAEVDGPALLTLGSGGLVLRLVRESGTRTLTSWSTAAGRPAVHPWLPLLAMVEEGDLVRVGDLRTGEVVLRLAVGDGG